MVCSNPFSDTLTFPTAGGARSHETAGEASRFERGDKEEIGEQRDGTGKGGRMMIKDIMGDLHLSLTKNVA